ncbi:12885_t:CDS:1, partial [Acaulospora colombiana]
FTDLGLYLHRAIKLRIAEYLTIGNFPHQKNEQHVSQSIELRSSCT